MKLQVKVKNEGINYIIPPHGVTVTFHVPSKCRNNCQFCIVNQNYYNDDLKPSNDAIRKAAEALVNADFVGNFVISGGEPLDDIDFVRGLAHFLNMNCKNKPVYLNTQLPVDRYKQFYNLSGNPYDDRFLTRDIDGVSISRHAARNSDEHFAVEGLQDHFIKKFAEKFPIRINCVLNDKTDIVGVVNRWKDAPVTVSFRRNYLDTTEVDLYEIDKETKQKFGEAGVIGDVDVKSDNVHCYKALILKEPTKAKFQYYACLENTCVKHRFIGDVEVYELHDIVVLPDGRAFDDWDIQNAHEIVI